MYPEHKFYFIFDRPYDASFIFHTNVIPIILSPPARHSILWCIWYEWRIPSLLKSIKADIFVSFDPYTSTRTSVKKITAIHDIAFMHFSHQMDWLSEKFMRHYTPKYVACSDLIVTVSYATKSDIIQTFDCSENKILVAPNAAANSYQTLSEDEQIEFRSKHTNGKPYFVYVGSIHPRKNVKRIFEAFEHFKNTYQTDHQLVMIGRMAWQYGEEKSYLETMRYRSEVLMIPHSQPEIISKWLASSVALLLVSHYEGFGVPIIEAQASGTAVITSAISSMPEVAGDGALIVDHMNVNDISHAMHTLSSNDHIRDEIIVKGFENQKKYNWDVSAAIIWNRMIETIENEV